MARTVDTSSTLEDFRQSYNGLAEEIGGLSDLRTSNKKSYKPIQELFDQAKNFIEDVFKNYLNKDSLVYQANSEFHLNCIYFGLLNFFLI